MEQSKNPTPAVLTNPFPAQHQQMVAQVPTQQPATQSVIAPSGAGSSSVCIMMVDAIDLAMRAKNYEKQLEGEASAHMDPPMALSILRNLLLSLHPVPPKGHYGAHIILMHKLPSIPILLRI